MPEVWKKLKHPSIPECENKFEISALGRLRNSLTGCMYKPEILSNNRISFRVRFGSQGDRLRIMADEAVAHTFLTNDGSNVHVRHKDANNLNNNVENLEWCTCSCDAHPFFVNTGAGISYPNKYFIIDDKTMMIEIDDSKNNQYFCYIDSEDFDKVRFCNWSVHKSSSTYYVYHHKYGMIHRLINNCPDELTVDHIDGNGLNNRKNNLRNVTIQKNLLNKRNCEMIGFDSVRNSYIVIWSDNGTQEKKRFSIKKFGDKAFVEAEKFRDYIRENLYYKMIDDELKSTIKF